MDIAVLVKRVPDPEALVSVSSGALSVEDKWAMGFFDEIALEQALRMKPVLLGKVIAITAGAPPCDETLRKAIAMGADRAVRVEIRSAGHDPLVRARTLAAAVKKSGAGVVLCGKQSGDEEAGFTGPAIAAVLGLPCVAGIIALESTTKGAKGRREMEGGHEAFELEWPAVLTASKGLAVPRTPQIMGVMKAMKAPIEVWSQASLGLEDAAPLFEAPSYEARRARGEVRFISGTPAEAARELVRALREEAKVL